MMAKFISLDDSSNKVSFESELVKHENYYEFIDKSVENTKINLYFDNESFTIKRFGNINMTLVFKNGKTTNTLYKDNLGLTMSLGIKTNELTIKNNKFYTSYDLILDKKVISSHKIWIIFA